MFKETITYTDYNGEKRTEDFYFNLTKAELVEMQFSKNGTMAEYIERIRATNDVPEIIKVFKQIILAAYGEKSLDGKHFYKVRNGVNLSEEFMQTEAFSELYMKLAQDDDAAANFIQKLIPAEYASKVAYKTSARDFAKNVVR